MCPFPSLFVIFSCFICHFSCCRLFLLFSYVKYVIGFISLGWVGSLVIFSSFFQSLLSFLLGDFIIIRGVMKILFHVRFEISIAPRVNKVLGTLYVAN